MMWSIISEAQVKSTPRQYSGNPGFLVVFLGYEKQTLV